MAWFCPLEADWGNVADWAAVVVALMGTVAVGILAWKANAIAKAARDATAKEAQRASEERVREANLIMMTCEPELRLIMTSTSALNLRVAEKRRAKFASDESRRAKVHDGIAAIDISTIERLFPRLHTLEAIDAVAFSLIIGAVGTLKRYAAELHRYTDTTNDKPVPADSPDDTQERRDVLRRLRDKRRERDEKSKELIDMMFSLYREQLSLVRDNAAQLVARASNIYKGIKPH